MKFVNLTPHSIALNDGREFPSEGNARITDSYTEFDENLTCCVKHGDIVDLPAPKKDVTYIVSAIVLTAAKEKGRKDVVAPATGHPLCKRENGFIVSVPGFVS